MSVRSLALASATFFAFQAGSFAQAPAGYYHPPAGTVTPVAAPTTSYERVSGRNNPALSFFGGSPALAYAARPPRPLPPPRPVNVGSVAKPFSGVQQAAAITPYLGLDAAREDESSLPNYFLYVRPQLEQQRINHVQQAQYRRLQQQVRTASAPGVVTSPHGGIPTTGHSSQFMNSGGYYPSLPR
jgi:hypothetical protein